MPKPQLSVLIAKRMATENERLLAAARAVLNGDPVLSKWRDDHTFGDTPDEAWEMGGCRVFAEALVGASKGRLLLVGLGAENELADDPDGEAYEHVLAYDPRTDRYLDVGGMHTKADLLAAYKLKPEWEAVMGGNVIEPFDEHHAWAIAYDADIAARAIRLLTEALR